MIFFMQSEIIQYLRQSDGYLSGEEISRRLHISRAGIWKNISELRKRGYEIDAVPHKGYCLVSAPDRLYEREVQFSLGTKVIGTRVIHYDSIPSTMEVAFELGVKGADEGTIICAETQTKGKGRLGRQWSSPKSKGVYTSIILRPKLTPANAGRITFLIAVALCEAIRNVSELDAVIKWPNDILIKGKKVAGILTEMNSEMDCVKFIVVGIGVNVNTSKSAIYPGATSLKIELKKQVSRIDMIQEILRSLEKWYLDFQSNGFVNVIDRWKEMSTTIGSLVKIADIDKIIEGKVIDLDEYGGLIIKKKDGIVVKRMSGDVEYL